MSTTGTLNDIQFYHFMHHVTHLKKEIMMTFDLLDWNASGEIGFFYMLVCILLCSEHHVEKNIFFRRSRLVFELLDMDGGHTISPAEFQPSGFLFNLKGHALNKIFYEFDVSGDEGLKRICQ
ncbi:EF-hand calcium-binding domain-containing protein 9 [Salmo salar]|uniref:EF-hand calcium-binding domain-containing protein 9 n=1 Tax=Salmo salar TaxID=8030 RepID=A0ABM3C8Z9_SALSA|nr:EF-hand calcium-binding domain-containing protein 9-like [Salmo salar]